MCISPNMLANGLKAACHQCWQCRERAINDWVGRNIAESKTASGAHSVTLTYGRDDRNESDHERATVLTYSDVQKYFKLLRFHGYPVRYFATGEYGGKKGRAHWHVMLYWQERVPDVLLGKRYDWSIQSRSGETVFPWDHGFSFFEAPEPAAIRYNCKYIQKDMGDNLRQGHLAMSKKPPLGMLYFQRLADAAVRQALAPQTLIYTFNDVRRRKLDGSTEVVPFMLNDRPAELYLEYFVRQWALLRPDKPLPPSTLVDGYLKWGVLSESAVELKEQERKEAAWNADRRDAIAAKMRVQQLEAQRAERQARDDRLLRAIEESSDGFVPFYPQQKGGDNVAQ